MATDSTPALPADPHRLRQRLVLQGGGFALLLLSAFSGSLYWGMAAQRAEDQRNQLRQLAPSASAQLPLIVHGSQEAPSALKFRPQQPLLPSPGVEQQRVQWFDANGTLLSDQGGHSGLGLAIARAIARRHSGDLSVSESRPGRCVLLVELPIEPTLS